MVHVERYQPENLRNGRSRGPSPNGHNGSPDTSDDDSTKNAKGNKSSKSKSEYEEKIRVGKDYQTICPDFIPVPERKLESLNDRALLVWSPTKDIPDIKLEEYISVAKERFGYNGEQALGMLFWHKHDLERAVMDLANFTPFPDEWTEEDKVLFEQAFQFHGKSFHRIRQMLPDKSIASLVKYYYSWKKTRSRTSVMDRQEKMKAKEGSENGSENGSNDDSDTEDKIQNNKQVTSSLKAKNLNKANSALNPGAIATNRISSRWSNDEYQLAIKGIRKHGKDFQTVAELIGTKTESQVNQFYTNYRKKYNLDEIIKEFEAKRLQEQQQQQQKLTEAQQKSTTNSNAANIAFSDVKKTDMKKPKSDDEIMAIDLVADDIPKEDEDMDDVTIIEADSLPSTTQKSIVDQVSLSVEPMDTISEISITAISSSSSTNGSSHQTQEPVPEVTISPAPGSNSTTTSTASLMAIVEQAKAAAV